MTTYSATKLESEQDRLQKIVVDLRRIDIPFSAKNDVIQARNNLERAIRELDQAIGAARRQERDAG